MIRPVASKHFTSHVDISKKSPNMRIDAKIGRHMSLGSVIEMAVSQRLSV